MTLRVVPLAADAYTGLRGSFVILEFAEEPVLVHLDYHITGLFLEEEGDLAAYGWRSGLSRMQPLHRCNDRADRPDCR